MSAGLRCGRDGNRYTATLVVSSARKDTLTIVRPLVCLELLLHGKRLATTGMGACERLAPARGMSLCDMLTEEMRLGESLMTHVTLVHLGEVVCLLVPLEMGGSPELLAARAVADIAHERLILLVLVRAEMGREMRRAEVRLPALVALVRPLASVRELVLGQARGLEVRLVASWMGAREAALRA